jgi:hypothetical protein
MPLYCMHWTMKGHPGQIMESVQKFLTTGAPLPESDKMIGRWHAPGSQKGWIIVETDSVAGLYEHASEVREFGAARVLDIDLRAGRGAA